jgi:hypothetical protein
VKLEPRTELVEDAGKEGPGMEGRGGRHRCCLSVGALGQRRRRGAAAMGQRRRRSSGGGGI